MRDFFQNPIHILFLAAAMLLLSGAANAQHTIHIPADQPTIQSAIDVAAAGDVLLVAPGTYAENLDFRGKAITLQSVEGAATTVLDGRRLAPTVSFTTGESRATTLTGFTIRNGAPASATVDQAAPHGAGILMDNASPTLSGNILTDNLCAALDGTNSAPLIENNRITGTRVSSVCVAQAVAPIVLTGSAASLTASLLRNIVESNDLTGSQIQPNAGAIALLAAPALVQGNILRRNIVPGDTPSGIQILANPTPAGSKPMLIEQNLIYGNNTHCGAGGLSIAILNPTLSATAPHLELEILNNTIVDNLTDSICSAGAQGSEVILAPGYLAPQILLANNILATMADHTVLQCDGALPEQMFHHNLVNNPNASAFGASCPDSGANILHDPMFQNRAQADYHLALASPAVDAGSNFLAALLPAEDLDATPRLQNATDQPTTIVDFGAYEHPAPHNVSATTTVLNSTISPSEAYQTVTLTVQVTTLQSGTQTTTPTGSVALTATAPGASPVTLITMPLDANGRASYTTSSLASGAWTLSAAYNGTETLAVSASAPMIQNVNPAASVLAFDITPSSALLSQTVTAVANITAPLSTHTPSGAIQFYDLASAKPVLLGPATLDGKGHAQLALPALTPGTHRILAVYSGTADFTASNLPPSAALVLTVGASDFSVTPSAATLTIQTFHHGPDTMALASIGGFADTVTFSCANLPLYASCAFAPDSAALAAGSKADMVLSIDTSVVHNFAWLTNPAILQPDASPIALASIFPLSLLTLLGLRRPLSRIGRCKLTLLAAMLPIFMLVGCGAGKYPDHTAPGTYQISVVATAARTGITHTTPITLIVTE